MWSLSQHQRLGGCWGYHHRTQPRGFTTEEPRQYECHAEVRGQGAGASQSRGEQSSVLDGMEPVMCPCFSRATAGRTLEEQRWWSTSLQEEPHYALALQVWGRSGPSGSCWPGAAGLQPCPGLVQAWDGV